MSSPPGIELPDFLSVPRPNLYRSSTSPVPIDAGHLVTGGITETNYTDCGKVRNRYYAVAAVNKMGFPFASRKPGTNDSFFENTPRRDRAA